MKKVFSLLAVLALVCMAGKAFALDSVVKSVKSAVATFGSAPELTLDVTVHSFGTGVSDYSTVAAKTGDKANVVEFNIPENFPFASTTATRVLGKDFLKVHSNIAQQPSGHIVLMTDNGDETSSYQAKSTRSEWWGGDINATLKNGLVRKGSTATYLEGDFAPIKTLTVAVSTATYKYKTAYPVSTDFNDSFNGGRTLPDLGDNITGSKTSYAEYETYIGLAGSSNGLWIGGGITAQQVEGNTYTLEDVIIFFSADFTKVTGGAEYGTDRIKFISFSE